MLYKQRLINEYLKEPISIGDLVEVEIPYLVEEYIKKQVVQTQKVFKGKGFTVVEINDETMLLETNLYSSIPIQLKSSYSQINRHLQQLIVSKEYVKKDIFKIGYNPIKNEGYKIKTLSVSLDHLLNILKRTKDYFDGISEVNFNSIVEINGQDFVYQRDFCWDLEDKQDLIESIYNNIDIGKIILRKRHFEWVENRFKQGKLENTGFYDVVDGKQRLSTIYDFTQDKFPDKNGLYYSDFSQKAVRQFENFSYFSYACLEESVDDKTTLEVFIKLNTKGRVLKSDTIDNALQIIQKF